MSTFPEIHHERVQSSELSTGLGVFLELWGHRLKSRGWELVLEGEWGGHRAGYREYGGPLVPQADYISSHFPHPSGPTPGTSCPLWQGEDAGLMVERGWRGRKTSESNGLCAEMPVPSAVCPPDSYSAIYQTPITCGCIT